MRRIRVWMCWWSIFRLHSMLSRKSPVIVPNMNTMSTMAPFTQNAAVSVCGSDCMPALSGPACVCVCQRVYAACSLRSDQVTRSHLQQIALYNLIRYYVLVCFVKKKKKIIGVSHPDTPIQHTRYTSVQKFGKIF